MMMMAVKDNSSTTFEKSWPKAANKTRPDALITSEIGPIRSSISGKLAYASAPIIKLLRNQLEFLV